MSSFSMQFVGVTAVAKANVYFDGRVVSHSLIFPDGTRKTLGLIYPGQFRFDTKQPERMEIISGQCRIQVNGQKETKTFESGTAFEIPGNSSFDICVKDGICEYICTYL